MKLFYQVFVEKNARKFLQISPSADFVTSMTQFSSLQNAKNRFSNFNPDSSWEYLFAPSKQIFFLKIKIFNIGTIDFLYNLYGKWRLNSLEIRQNFLSIITLMNSVGTSVWTSENTKLIFLRKVKILH
jgi:hypothetical protein